MYAGGLRRKLFTADDRSPRRQLSGSSPPVRFSFIQTLGTDGWKRNVERRSIAYNYIIGFATSRFSRNAFVFKLFGMYAIHGPYVRVDVAVFGGRAAASCVCVCVCVTINFEM